MRALQMFRAFALCLALLLAACGGGEVKPSVDTTPNIEALFVAPKPSYALKKFEYVPPKPAAAVVAEAKGDRLPATSEEASFKIEDEAGSPLGSYELEPQRGKGYPELKIVLTARRIGDAAAPAAVRPTCKEKCTYTLSKTYAVEVSDDKLVQLVPRGDGLALIAKTLSLDVPRAVDVMFSVDDRVFSRRRVVLLAE